MRVSKEKVKDRKDALVFVKEAIELYNKWLN
jgi:hypothetical protein